MTTENRAHILEIFRYLPIEEYKKHSRVVSEKLGVGYKDVLACAVDIKGLNYNVLLTDYEFKAPVEFCTNHGCAKTGDTCLQCLIQ